MALPTQLGCNGGTAIPAMVPQRESSQISDQPVLPAPSVASKVAKKPRERWTAEEHERFLAGLKMFHRDWKSIESAFLLNDYRSLRLEYEARVTAPYHI